MTIAQITEKMIAFSGGDKHDIDHFLRVWGLARTIGQLEGLDEEKQFLLEAAALTHDIACPLCRIKYGHAAGKYQEKEGGGLVGSFFIGSGLSYPQVERIAWLVSHHHTYTHIDGMDHQILLEADYLVNAMEQGFSKEAVGNFLRLVMRTDSGRRMAAALLGV